MKSRLIVNCQLLIETSNLFKRRAQQDMSPSCDNT